MDRAAVDVGNFANIKRLKRLRQAAYCGVAELLERRMLLSSTPTAATRAAIASSQPWFIQNVGQWADPTVRYALKTDVGSIVMTDEGPVFNVLNGENSEQFSVHFDGANTVSPTGSGKSKGVYNYLTVGVTDVHGYSKIAYKGLYDGIDLQTWGKKSNLKYEFHVASGADYSQVQLSYDGIQGLSIDAKGRLHVTTKYGEMVDDAPVVYQNINGKRVKVASSFKLIDSNTYAFQVKGNYDHSKELILDPTVTWGTYFGGADGADNGNSVVVDSALNVYITGSTNSTDFPLLNAIDGVKGGNGTDAFVTKLDVNGDLIWSTYFGGNRADAGVGIEVKHDGSQVYVAGTTASSDTTFPSTADGFQPTYAGGNNEGFVATFLADGTFSWASYLGTSAGDTVTSTALDANDILYVTGQQNAPIGYVAKINPDPSARSLISETLIGTTGNTLVQGVAISPDAQSVYVVGDTTASDFLVIGRPKDQNRDVFVAAYDVTFANTPTELWVNRWTRYLGGEGADTGGAIALNAAGVLAVTGVTGSDEFPVTPGKAANADTLRGGNSNDAFIALYDTAGAEKYVSFVGGNLADAGNGLIVDNNDHFILVGTSASVDLPFKNTVGGQFRNNGGNDAFYGVFDNKGQFSILDEYGGTQGDTGVDIAVDSLGAIYIVGTTGSTDLNQGPVPEPIPGEVTPPPRTNLGGNDVFVARIALSVQAAPPSAPVNLAAIAQPNGSIRLTWGDLSTTEIGFKIYRSTSKSAKVGQFTQIASVGANTVSYTDPDVAPGVTYYYYVASYIGALQNPSNIAQATTGSSSVNAPTDLTATAVSGTRVNLTWTDNSNNETGFEIWREVVADDVWQLIGTSPGGSTSFADTNGLVSGVTYAYRVRAVNDVRVSPFTEPFVVTTRAGNFVAAPTDVNASRITDTSVLITWTDNSDNETGFVVERADFGSTDFTALTPNSPANATSFLDTTAEAGHIYIYRVRALNGAISSSASGFATSDLDQALRRPTRVEAVANSSTQIKITWKDNSSVESGFIIERAQNQPNDWTVIHTTAANVTSYYDKQAVTGRRYFYRIRATDGTHNFSQYSDRATARALPRFVTAPRAPSNLRGKLLSSTSVRLTWKDNANDETFYSIERSTSLDGGFREVGKSDLSENFFVDSKLVAGKTYYYRVRAYNGAIKSSTSNILKIRMSAVAAKTKTSSVSTATAAATRSTSLFSSKKVSDMADDVLGQV